MIHDSKIQSDEKKFRELILLIAERSEGDHRFGATKLNKLLFYVDFLAYLSLGKPVTGQTYQKLDNGPAPRRLMPVTKKMEEQGEIAFRKENYFGKEKRRAVALREPDLSLFSGPEVGLIEEVINDFWGKNASEISNDSHKFLGWELAALGEDIPYEVALVQACESHHRIEDHAAKLATLAKNCLSNN